MARCHLSCIYSASLLNHHLPTWICLTEALNLHARASGQPPNPALGVPLDRAGRVRVNPDLTIPDHPEGYVVGDLARLVVDGVPVPGVAPPRCRKPVTPRPTSACPPARARSPVPLSQQGLARHDRPLGGRRSTRHVKLSGPIAWLAWLLIHILFLIGFRNRVLVVLQWAWPFRSYDRGPA